MREQEWHGIEVAHFSYKLLTKCCRLKKQLLFSNWILCNALQTVSISRYIYIWNFTKLCLTLKPEMHYTKNTKQRGNTGLTIHVSKLISWENMLWRSDSYFKSSTWTGFWKPTGDQEINSTFLMQAWIRTYLRSTNPLKNWKNQNHSWNSWISSFEEVHHLKFKPHDFPLENTE